MANEIANRTGFEIGKIRKPKPHPGWPELVLQDIGSIKIIPPKGTSFELMGEPKTSDWEEHLTWQKGRITQFREDFCILGQRK